MGSFGVLETHGILLRSENQLRATSESLGWNNIYASLQREQPYEASYKGVPDDLIIIHLDGPVGVNRTVCGREMRRIIPPRGLFMMPGRTDFSVRLEQQLDSLHIYLRHNLIADVARDTVKGDSDRIELIPKIGEEDPLIAQLMLEVRDLIESKDPTDAAYIEYVSLALAARLVRRHSSMSHAPEATQPKPGGLSRTQIKRVTEFIDANLERNISLTKMAESIGLTVTHFARRFKVSMGVPPHQYLIGCRFERAKWLLEQTDTGLAEIAFSAGFSHQEHLTRIFRRLGKTTPGAYRRLLRS